MNIFYLSPDPVEAARFQHDKHVVKMILESAQMLSCVAQTVPWAIESHAIVREAAPIYPPLYGVTHRNHPCTIWAGASKANFVWLTIHLDALVSEYSHRFPGRTHATEGLRFVFAMMAANLAAIPHETKPHRRNAGFYNESVQVNSAILDWAVRNHDEPALAMPDSFKIGKAYESYRAYYAQTKVVEMDARWTNREVPYWLRFKPSPELAARLAQIDADRLAGKATLVKRPARARTTPVLIMPSAPLPGSAAATPGFTLRIKSR